MVIETGQMAPDFSLPSTTGGEVTLSDLYPKSPVVVAFYPRDDTPG